MATNPWVGSASDTFPGASNLHEHDVQLDQNSEDDRSNSDSSSAVRYQAESRQRRSVYPNTKRYYLSFISFCTSFCLIYAAFFPLQSLQGSLNATVGFVSLASLYVCFQLSSTVAPIFNKIFGPKYVIVTAYFFFVLYTACNYYPETYTLIPSSVALGCAHGPLWAAANFYTVSQAKKVATALRKKPEAYIGKFTGIFFMFFFVGGCIGNAIASSILLPDSGGLNIPSSNGSGVQCNIDPSLTAEVSPWARYTLLSIYLSFDIAAIVTAAFGMKKIGETSYTEKSLKMFVREGKSNAKTLIKMFFNWKYMLVMPVICYQGLHSAFISGAFNKFYVSDCVGVGYVGIVQIVWAFCGGMSSYIIGRLMAKVPRLFLLYCNALYDAATLFFMSFWEIVPSFSAIFVLTISFAVTDGFLNTIPTSFVGIITPEVKQDVAFGIQRFVMSFGFMSSFLLSSYLPNIYIFVYILLALLPLQLVAFSIVDLILGKQIKPFLKEIFCIGQRGNYDVRKGTERTVDETDGTDSSSSPEGNNAEKENGVLSTFDYWTERVLSVVFIEQTGV